MGTDKNIMEIGGYFYAGHTHRNARPSPTVVYKHYHGDINEPKPTFPKRQTDIREIHAVHDVADKGIICQKIRLSKQHTTIHSKHVQ